MAQVRKRLPTNVAGNFFVDSTCINCDTCRQLAPHTFVEDGDFSAVQRQPETEQEELQAYQALLACPVGSIGALAKKRDALSQARETFPLHLEGGVYYCGFTSEQSYGAQSYFIQHQEGNWLIDCPRYLKHLVEAFKRLGGIRYIFLSHEDDVADAARYANQFGAARMIHEGDSEAMPGAEWIIRGIDVVDAMPQFRVIPVPGHTEGSLALLYDDRYLFTGDHVWWDREHRRLEVPSVLVWNGDRLRSSTERLLEYSFEWVLPGHGDRIQLPSHDMKDQVQKLLRRRGRVRE